MVGTGYSAHLTDLPISLSVGTVVIDRDKKQTITQMFLRVWNAGNVCLVCGLLNPQFCKSNWQNSHHFLPRHCIVQIASFSNPIRSAITLTTYANNVKMMGMYKWEPQQFLMASFPSCLMCSLHLVSKVFLAVALVGSRSSNSSRKSINLLA